jgi:two-component system OmpR family sensor kinase
MFRSLASRLLLTYLLVTVLVAILAGISLLVLLQSTPLADRLAWQSLQAEANTLVPRVERAFEQDQSEALAAGRLAQRLRSRALVVSAQGELMAQGGMVTIEGVDAALAGAAIANGAGQGETQDALGRRWLYVARALTTGDTLIVAAPRPTLRALLVYGDYLLAPLLKAAIVGLAVSVVLAWLVSRWVTAPLRRLAGAAQSVAASRYEQRVPLEGPAEVESLAADFNQMVQRVQATQQGQRDFVANVSHELRTPLTSIDGFAQAILDGTAADRDSQMHAAHVIHEESDRLARLVDDLLDLARLDAGQMTFTRVPVDLNAVVARVADGLSLRAQEREVQLENEVTGLPSVSGDGDRLAQVFTNLIDNALKHTPAGGMVRLRGEALAGEVRVLVEDNGPGIPAEDLSRIFERFYQVDKARRGGEGRGTGLGLAISREIVQALGGHLTAISAPGQGSRFTVQLPLDLSTSSTVSRRRP